MEEMEVNQSANGLEVSSEATERRQDVMVQKNRGQVFDRNDSLEVIWVKRMVLKIIFVYYCYNCSFSVQFSVDQTSQSIFDMF